MEISKEIGVVVEAIKNDPEYRRSWEANIAIAFIDEWQRAADNGDLPSMPKQIHRIANRAAVNFLTTFTSMRAN